MLARGQDGLRRRPRQHHLWRAGRAGAPHGCRPAGARPQARGARAAADARQHRLAGRFLGALYAGVVPWRQHPAHARRLRLRAPAQPGPGCLVSAALLPTLQAAMEKDRQRCSTCSCRASPRPCPPARRPSTPSSARIRPWRRPLPRNATSPPSGCIHRLDRPAQGTCTPTPPSLDRRALCRPVLGMKESDTVLRRQAVLRLRPGRCAVLPLERRRHRRADGRAAHADACFKPSPSTSPPSSRRAHGLCGHARLRRAAAARSGRAAAVPRPARRCRARLASVSPLIRLRDHRRHRLDRVLHIFLSNPPGQHALRHHRPAGGGHELELRGEDGRPVPAGEIGDLYIRGPSSALMYGNNREKSRDTSRAAGPRAATSTSAMPTATTPTRPQQRHAQGERPVPRPSRSRPR